MKISKTFTLSFLTQKSAPIEKFEIKKVDDFLNKNPRCSDCFLNKGCICQMYTMIQNNIKNQYVIDILKELFKKYNIKSLTLEKYKQNIINIQIPRIEYKKLRKITGLIEFIKSTSSCNHLKYIGTNNKLKHFNLFFG